MTANSQQQVRRTLILTWGTLAQSAGAMFQQRMDGRQGPTTAVQCLAIEASWSESEVITAVTQALTHISPPNLAALLAEQGWQLQDGGDLFLIYLFAAQPDSCDYLTTLVQQAAGLIYAYLGLEPATLLLWLVGDMSEADITSILTTAPTMTRGTGILSLRNELGLRLPQTADLCHIAAELLYCFTATPLQTLPEQLQARSDSGFTGENSFFTVGLQGWVWSVEASQTAFVQHWLGDVLAYWTAPTTDPIPAVEAGVWLDSHQLSGEAFAQQALLSREQQPPDFTMANSQMLWPWQMPTVWNKLQFAQAIDNEALTVYGKHACLRLGDPLYEGTLALQIEAARLLDEQPVGGVSRTCSWLQTLIAECEEQIERTLDREETFTETTAMLIEERNQVESNLKRWLVEWPGETWSDWLRMGLRPWTWPGLAWRYWQIQQALGQIGIIWTQQAVLQRQIIQNKMARQGLAELIPILRRVYNQVEEVGEMLSSLARSVTSKSEMSEPPLSSEPPLLPLAVPASLYEQLVPDPTGEAVSAAAQVGGLGQQVTALDDTVEIPLRRLGKERVAALGQWGCADVLLAQFEAEALQAHCHFAWEAACPLWRVDEAQLGEQQRAQVGQLTAVCGHNCQQATPYLPQEENALWLLETADKTHLWLLRVRTGLVLNQASK
ncbi:MAG: hypothetical protein H6658_09765 [Ardenticatenaceae bacterium]|nr:hypothetical protein [Ardenticatenaceae bacterium]